MEAIEQIAKNFPAGFLQAFLMNGLLIGGAFFIFWKLFKKRFKNYRIQLKERFNTKQLKRELKNALFTLMVGALYSVIVIYLSTQGYTKIYLDINDYSYAYVIFGFFVLLFIDDT